MLVRPVQDRDFEQIEGWFSSRDRRMFSRSHFPAHGFIIDDVAAGFVYFTDSVLAIIDCYISNPQSNPELRSHALDQITEKLLDTARAHGFKLVKCDTQLDAIKKRALKFGFQPIGSFYSLSREI